MKNVASLFLCAGVLALSGCAAPSNKLECLFQPGRIIELSVCSDQRRSRGDKVAVLKEAGALPSNCERIGPVSGFAQATVGQATPAAELAARERVADMGGDTLLISSVNQGTSSASMTVRGTALRCQGPSSSE